MLMGISSLREGLPITKTNDEELGSVKPHEENSAPKRAKLRCYDEEGRHQPGWKTYGTQREDHNNGIYLCKRVESAHVRLTRNWTLECWKGASLPTQALLSLQTAPAPSKQCGDHLQVRETVQTQSARPRELSTQPRCWNVVASSVHSPHVHGNR